MAHIIHRFMVTLVYQLTGIGKSEVTVCGDRLSGFLVSSDRVKQPNIRSSLQLRQLFDLGSDDSFPAEP